MITDEQLGRMYDAASQINVEGTRTYSSAGFVAPFYITDESSAEPDVNWPGELMDIAQDYNEIRDKLRAARIKVMRRALDHPR